MKDVSKIQIFCCRFYCNTSANPLEERIKTNFQENVLESNTMLIELDTRQGFFSVATTTWRQCVRASVTYYAKGSNSRPLCQNLITLNVFSDKAPTNILWRCRDTCGECPALLVILEHFVSGTRGGKITCRKLFGPWGRIVVWGGGGFFVYQ